MPTVVTSPMIKGRIFNNTGEPLNSMDLTITTGNLPSLKCFEDNTFKATFSAIINASSSPFTSLLKMQNFNNLDSLNPASTILTHLNGGLCHSNNISTATKSILVYNNFNINDTTEVFMYAKNGNDPVANSIKVSTSPNNNNNLPQIVIYNDNSYIISWSCKNKVTQTSSSLICFRAYDANDVYLFIRG
jgi:hypothetical protein